ncbi:hypothetical protein EHI8A_014000 [Entamoeba histolytica HM-1:IMSS-B]|uniref:SGNH hydrolase-type esterase domain-containing protein n=6 Tax=Entamoeba histolytica TaxID=5759 RepID=C4LXQ8_ENTH1|nr:hypothetical protein EHI_014200 [Entamoeba histolytica HM-1:IMSS]EMD46922.1 Hypothetical protein EHI5A_004920 [Entamoeba histolytica KU27]EMH75602.1 hypothetical protein EHI8A_014000 [Entamoeba histolytica HM-1:IMSS-B]EMS17341.1 hypothetical protein KM1_007550 [Entamoeba histolytica HM-3:IMSS]ENY61970.1 hypothetical protein EHI7A_002350 [Entamoeba histolytica HM-1:IMSS-A]GAT93551.1 hypothetical protein CL6EHI_014200 [Entamoeba histolytica]|eukprot:XP_655051.1 hypothetical protein EHI_014200 [Entamoeba histolytica HM-1:IMSS]
MELSLQQYNTLDIPQGLTHQNIFFEGRIEEEKSLVFFDWPNTSLNFMLPCGSTTFYMRCVGTCLLKFVASELPLIRRIPPFHGLPKELEFNTFVIESNYFTITMVNKKPIAQKVSLIKISEARDGAICFYGVNRRMEQFDIQPRKKIEIIGDSLCCGYGMFPLSQCDSVPLQSDSSEAWCSQIVRKLNLESHMVAWSGIGVVRNCDEVEFPNDKKNIDKLWRRRNAGENKSKWDFTEWIPDYVMVNIGSNDFWDVGASNPSRNDIPTAFVQKEEEIIQEIREKESLQACLSSDSSSNDISKSDTEIEEEIKNNKTKKEKLVLPSKLGRVVSPHEAEEIQNILVENKEKENHIIKRLLQEWNESHEQKQTILDDFIANDESELDEVFEQRCEEFISHILATYKKAKIIIVIGPLLAREGEIAWKTALKALQQKEPGRVFEVNCQLCYDENKKECWGFRRHPTYIAHTLIANCLLPQIEQIIH